MRTHARRGAAVQTPLCESLGTLTYARHLCTSAPTCAQTTTPSQLHTICAEGHCVWLRVVFDPRMHGCVRQRPYEYRHARDACMHGQSRIQSRVTRCSRTFLNHTISSGVNKVVICATLSVCANCNTTAKIKHRRSKILTLWWTSP
jgi:hypothetical protein